MRPLLVAIVAVATTACEAAPQDLREEGEPLPLSAMTLNLATLSGTERAAMVGHIAAIGPEILATQECVSCEELATELPSHYQLAAPARSDVGIIIDSRRWQVERDGVVVLARDDDGWGERLASWVLLSNVESLQRLYVYSTHWCSPWRSFMDRCDDARHVEYAEAIIRDISRREFDAPTLVLGDLNVLDGFEDARAVRALLESGLADVFRRDNPDSDGSTFIGSSFAPPGRLDYIFATEPVEVLGSRIERDAPEPPLGSDHYAVIAELLFR